MYFSLDYVEKVENCESKPKLRILKKSTVNGNDNPKENKHNFSPDDQFDDQNIKLTFYLSYFNPQIF